MRQKVKAVYFSDSEEEILEWLEGKGAFSKYIKGLIRRDIRTEKEGVDPRIVDMVTQALEIRLAGRFVATNISAPGMGSEVDSSLLAGIF
jgi:hypothetical protein